MIITQLIMITVKTTLYGMVSSQVASTSFTTFNMMRCATNEMYAMYYSGAFFPKPFLTNLLCLQN